MTIAPRGWVSPHLQLHCCPRATRLIVFKAVQKGQINSKTKYSAWILCGPKYPKLLGTSCCLFGVWELGCFFFCFLLPQVQSFGLNSIQLPLSRHFFFQCSRTNALMEQSWMVPRLLPLSFKLAATQKVLRITSYSAFAMSRHWTLPSSGSSKMSWCLWSECSA